MPASSPGAEAKRTLVMMMMMKKNISPFLLVLWTQRPVDQSGKPTDFFPTFPLAEKLLWPFAAQAERAGKGETPPPLMVYLSKDGEICHFRVWL